MSPRLPMISPHTGNGLVARHIVATYPYRDAAGTVIYDAVRFEPKSFMPRHPDSPRGAMVAGLDGVLERVPYRLPELLAEPGRAVMWVEGEKDADRLAAGGLLATTTLGGAKSYRRHAAAYAEHFRGRRLIAVLTDNDSDGRAYSADVAASLYRVGAGVRLLELPGLAPKGDVSDWLDVGHTVEELCELVKAAPRWEPSTNVPGASAADTDTPPVGLLLSEVKPERIEWLWHGRLARGKVTLIDGDPGNGKSALTLDIAARITKGTAWPDGSPCPSGGVVLLTAEDGLADTVRPRLDAVGADPSRVVAVPLVGTGDDARLPSIPADLNTVERAIRRVGAVLLIVDPLMAYLGSDVSSHKDQDVRRALAPLASMADRLGVAVAVVRHLNKTNAGPPMYRGGGSIGIIGAARIALLVGRDQADDTRLVMAGVKTNIGPMPPSLAYRLEPADNGVVRLAWEPGECSVTASDLLATATDEESRSAVDEAEEVLRALLADGPVEAKIARRRVEQEAGVSHATVDKAKSRLGVKVHREGFGPGGRFLWSLSPRTYIEPIEPTPENGRFYGATVGSMGAEREKETTAVVEALDL